MESRWYVPPGFTLENTKIADRGHALHITKPAWERILGMKDKKKLEEDARQAELDKKKKMKEDSEAMTKNWENSIENMRKRKEEDRARSIRERLESRDMLYYEMKMEQEARRTEYIKSVRRKMYMREAFPKQLNEALLEGHVRKEREAQISLNNMIAQHWKDEENQYAEKVKKEAQEENEGKGAAKKMELHKRRIYTAGLLKQIKDNEDRANEERQRKIEKELKDVECMAREMKEFEDYEKKVKHDNEVKKRKELDDAMLVKKKLDEQKALEEKEMDAIIELQSRAKHELACKMKWRLEEIKNEADARRESIFKKIAKVAADNTAKEEAARQKAIAEREAREEAERKKKEEHQKKMIADLCKSREDTIERMIKEEKERKQFNMWETANSLKKAEVVRDQDKEYALSINAHVDERVQELNDCRKYSKMIELFEFLDEKLYKHFKEAQHERKDKEFFAYAEEIKDLAEKNKLSTYAIEKVIELYKKENSIEDKIDISKLRPECAPPRQKLVKNVPGKRAHDPRSDPNYGRCRCYKDRLLR